MSPKDKKEHPGNPNTENKAVDVAALVVVVVVVVLTLTHHHNTMQSVVAGQAPITLEWKKYLGKNKNKQRIVHMLTVSHRSFKLCYNMPRAIRRAYTLLRYLFCVNTRGHLIIASPHGFDHSPDNSLAFTVKPRSHLVSQTFRHYSFSRSLLLYFARIYVAIYVIVFHPPTLFRSDPSPFPFNARAVRLHPGDYYFFISEFENGKMELTNAKKASAK